MLEITRAQHRHARQTDARAHSPAASDGTSTPCRYRREFAGFHVCQATMQVAVVTAKDCDRCSVPETLDRVDCFFLRARVDLTPAPRVQWTCGATEDLVEPDAPDDCDACRGERARGRRTL